MEGGYNCCEISNICMLDATMLKIKTVKFITWTNGNKNLL